MLLTQKLSHKFPQFAPTIRVGGLSVTDQQIIAQHKSGAVKAFTPDQLAEAEAWWEEQDQLEVLRRQQRGGERDEPNCGGR